MKVIQHNDPFNHSFSKDKISPNLISFLEMVKQQFSFDQANIYHLTNENINDYKSVITKAIGNRIKMIRGIGPRDNQDNLIKEIKSEFDEIIDANIFPASLIIFDYIYGSAVESSTVFFHEHDGLLLINQLSSLMFEKQSFYSRPITTDDGHHYAPVIQAIGYESSTTNGLFPIGSFLIPVSSGKNNFEYAYGNREHVQKKAELQLRELEAGQFDFKQLTLLPNFDIHQFVSRYDSKPKVLNSKLIYNDEVIFNDYDIIDRDPHKIIMQKLTPFLTDFKSQYEIIDDIPVQVSAEYYQHFKTNIFPVIEMAKC